MIVEVDYIILNKTIKTMITELEYQLANKIVERYKLQQFEDQGQFVLQDGAPHCRCGKKAVDLRNNQVFLCSGITIPHGCTYKKTIEHPCICDEIHEANKKPNVIASGFCMKHKTDWV
tara:strand:+ start:1690 stop:2043 length:354 start_codon:yes stop_codon:yes gene_type:complete